MFKCGVFSGPHFPVFGLNKGKYRSEKTPYLDIFAQCSFGKYIINNGRTYHVPSSPRAFGFAPASKSNSAYFDLGNLHAYINGV